MCIFGEILLWLLENETQDQASILVRGRENLTTEQILLPFRCYAVPMENLKLPVSDSCKYPIQWPYFILFHFCRSMG